MEKQLILIDLDDTLWDTWANNQESLNELYTALEWGRYFSSFEAFFEEYYYPVNHTLWERYNKEEISKAELSYERLFRPLYLRHKDWVEGAIQAEHTELIQHLSQVLDNPRSYWDEANERFMSYIRSKRRLCPGAMELMQALHERYQVCILSNGFPEVQYAKLDNTGLKQYVDAVVLSDEVGYNKPNPRLFAYALEQMSCPPEKAIMIGDSWASDIRGASAAGVDSIWYNRYTLDTPKEDITPPKAIVTHLNEIIPLL